MLKGPGRCAGLFHDRPANDQAQGSIDVSLIGGIRLREPLDKAPGAMRLGLLSDYLVWKSYSLDAPVRWCFVVIVDPLIVVTVPVPFVARLVLRCPFELVFREIDAVSSEIGVIF